VSDFLHGVVAGIVAVHVASAVVMLLILADHERAEPHKNDARIVK